MILHEAKKAERKGHTVYTTLCGRMNKQSHDGMNIADTAAQVTCKFCLRAMKREKDRKFDSFIKEVKAVCRKYKAQIAVEMYDSIIITTLKDNEPEIYAPDIVNELD